MSIASTPSRTTPAQYSKPIILDAYDDPIADEEALSIYRWLDSIEFTKTRKTAANRDFSDAVMMAELVAHHIPKICNATFFIPASATAKKIENWNHLNSKVFRRIGYQFTPELIQKLATSRPGAIEKVLKAIRPSLLLGHRAIVPVCQKLDGIKSRLLDYRKPSTKSSIEIPQTPRESSRASKSSVKSKVKNVRPRSSALPVREKAPISRVPQSATLESHVKNRTVEQPQKDDAHELTGDSTDIGDLLENYVVFKRPSTANTEKSEMSVDSGRNELQKAVPSKMPTKLPRAAPKSSWLSTGPDENANKQSVLVDKTQIKVPEDEQPIDIICTPNDQVLSREISSYSTEEETTEDDGFDDLERKLRGRGKSFKKQVIKYEYKEEVVLNGTGSYLLPNKKKLDNVRRNYMTPANKDPKCRGYGLV